MLATALLHSFKGIPDRKWQRTGRKVSARRATPPYTSSPSRQHLLLPLRQHAPKSGRVVRPCQQEILLFAHVAGQVEKVLVLAFAVVLGDVLEYAIAHGPPGFLAVAGAAETRWPGERPRVLPLPRLTH